MGEMIDRMREVLEEMAGTGGSAMYMDHHHNIEALRKDGNPLDTADKI
jgi:hypothetical protein